MVYHYPHFNRQSSDNEIRREVIAYAEKLINLGLNRGSSGNLSVRTDNGFYITPSGVDSTSLKLDSIVEMSLDGNIISGQNPSSEWRFHRDILNANPQVNAVIHTHSPYATAFSCQRMDMPSFHYMIAIAGGRNIQCASYAVFGSQTLSENVLDALKGRRACFLANHGMIATGKNLKQALDIAIEVESLSQQFMTLKSTEGFVLLTEDEMAEVIEKFKSYGNWSK